MSKDNRENGGLKELSSLAKIATRSWSEPNKYIYRHKKKLKKNNGWCGAMTEKGK